MNLNERIERLSFFLDNIRPEDTHILETELRLFHDITVSEASPAYDALIREAKERINENAWKTASAELDPARIVPEPETNLQSYLIDDAFQMRFPDGTVKCVTFGKENGGISQTASICALINNGRYPSIQELYDKFEFIHSYRVLLKHGMADGLCQEYVRLLLNDPQTNRMEVLLLFRDGTCYSVNSTAPGGAAGIFTDDPALPEILENAIRYPNAHPLEIG